MTISLCMIVKNEENVLERCLKCAGEFADEIVIVDTGSSDKTKEIAKKFTDKIYDFKWIEDFSAARNFAFGKATKDYQMWLDADDVITEENIEKILELKESPELDSGDIDIVTMKYVLSWDNNKTPNMISTRERLFKRERGYIWQDPIHECIPLIGNIKYTNIEIEHRPLPGSKIGSSNRNLRIYEMMESEKKHMTPRSLYYFARELRDHGQNEKAILYFERFLNTNEGWVEDNIAACYILSNLYTAIGYTEKVIPILLQSFKYAPPRAEICCMLGYYYKNLEQYDNAFGWFKIATDLDTNDSSGFYMVDYWGYIPNIECCYCAYKLDKTKEAIEFNEKAALYKPDDASVLYNREFFST